MLEGGTMLVWVRTVFAVFFGLFLFGIAALSVWLATFTHITTESTKTGKYLHLSGRVLVMVAMTAILGLILAAVIVGGLYIFGTGVSR
jgi:hypothetical protein